MYAIKTYITLVRIFNSEISKQMTLTFINKTFINLKISYKNSSKLLHKTQQNCTYIMYCI